MIHEMNKISDVCLGENNKVVSLNEHPLELCSLYVMPTIKEIK